ncbi:Annexin_2 [Hexamita inflata]|uniref:Annexin 2 n=1 Tax=Hexamita inflata TaxID=28002 RepID=A0AA86TQV2_9EUKA|nr:Annexin 2 [Hexamita inflata]
MQTQLEYFNLQLQNGQTFDETKCSIQSKPLFQASDYVQFAQEIYDSCQFDSFDEQRFLNILLQCTVEDMCKVNHAFLACYGCSISSCITKDCNTNFEKVILGSVQNRYTFWATQIHQTLTLSTIDVSSLCDLIIMADSNDMSAINYEYQRLYGSQIQESITFTPFSEASHFSVDKSCTKLLCAWCSQLRYGRNSIEHDVVSLNESFKAEHADYNSLIRVLCTSTQVEFKMMCEQYHTKYSCTLRAAIENVENQYLRMAAVLAHDSLLNPASCCAQILRQALTSCDYNNMLVSLAVLFRDRYSSTVGRWYDGSISSDINGFVVSSQSDWNQGVLNQIWRAE